MKKINVLLAMVIFATISLAGCGGSSDYQASNKESSKETIVQKSVVQEGLATFTDNSTEEEVYIFVESEDGESLSEVDIQFWDSDNYELFILEDPSGKYLPAFEIYPHNSSHWITMNLLGNGDDSQIEEIPLASEKGRSIENLLTDPDIDIVYHGRFTPEEIDRVDNIHLAIISSVAGSVAKFYKYVSKFIDFGEIINKFFGTEYEEPEFYDMYTLLPKSGVTTSIYWLEPVVEDVIVVDTVDADGDGYSESDGDCDDSDGDVNPGVEEVCEDPVDNNCDGLVDEGCTSGIEISWAYINDPGVSGHESFVGEMSKYEITNAQYCLFLNDALASGDIIFDDDDLYNDVFGADGSNEGEDYVNNLYYDGNGSSYYTYFPESHHYVSNNSIRSKLARINYADGVFSVAEGFENHPVTFVSLYGASAFASYYGYRLPTEWEWQAVADYDGSYIYGSGEEIDSNLANYKDYTHVDKTTVVGSFGSFGYGLYDMAGNVFEWTSSKFTDGYRVMRGGSYGSSSEHCAVSDRGSKWGPEKTYGPWVGFRVVR